MNASCLDEKGRFKSCPYRVYTDEHKAVLRGQGDFTSQCFYPCIGEGCIAYHVGVCLRLAAALKEDLKMTNDERRPTGLLHSADELRQLIRENPTLPLIVFAGEEANSGDYSYMSCSYVKAYKENISTALKASTTVCASPTGTSSRKPSQIVLPTGIAPMRSLTLL